MIDKKMLSEVKTIVSHEHCHDGVASALIAKVALPDAKVVFLRYQSPEHKRFEAEPGLLFVDITPHPESDIDAFVKAKTVVLDHHQGVKDLVARFGERGVYTDEPGVSGALLAYRHVWFQFHGGDAPHVREFASLAGIYDTWQRDSEQWEQASAQAAALRFWPFETLLPWFHQFIADNGAAFANALNVGYVLRQKEASDVKKLIKHGYRFTSGTTKTGSIQVLVVSGKSLINEVADQETEADLVMGFHFLCDPDPQVEWSCRTRKSFPVLDFVKCHGGGGHPKAGGFRVSARGQGVEPYYLAELLVRSWAEFSSKQTKG